VYQQLKSILGAIVVQQAESSLLHRVEASILPLANPKDRGQKATQGAPEAGTDSSPVGFSICDRPIRPSARLKPQTYQRHRPRDDGVQSQPRVRNPRCGGCDDRKGCNLTPDGSGPKVFGSAMHNARFP
jgi:hypothetical protein